MPKICHITTVHYQYDTRILHRECVSLAQRGFEVHLIVANQEAGTYNGVQMHSIVAPAGNRIQRMVGTARSAFEKALELDADLYHFHDPELLRIGRKLQRAGKKVIYDSHEHVPHQIRTKAYLPSWLRPIIAAGFEWYENRMVRKMDAVVTATDLVRDRFSPINPRTVDVNNFPRMDTLFVGQKERTMDVVYVGLINRIRGIREMLEALTHPGAWKLHLIGYFESAELEAEMRQHPGWARVQFHGRQSREEVAQSLATSKIGIVTFLPAPNHNRNQPNKLFEYMAAGLPVVCSHFDRWKNIVETANCGICIDPADPKAIAAAVQQLLEKPEQARIMGEHGRKAMEEHYNWQSEEDKLVTLYQELLHGA